MSNAVRLPLHLKIGALAILFLTACGGNVGVNSGVVGGECRTDQDCAEECLEGKDFPDGTCSVECRDHDDCPGGSWCIGKEGGVCLMACEDDGDCRDNYDCEEKDSEDGGDEWVCIQ